MNIKNNLKKTFTGIMAAALINTAYAASSSELMIGKDKSQFETKVSGELFKNMSYFNKTKINTDYDNNVGAFLLTDGYYNLGKGVKGVFEIQAAPKLGVVSRAGLSYSIKKGKLTAYLAPTVNLNQKTNLQLYNINNLTKKLNKKIGINLGLENVILIGKQSFKGSINNRIGLKVGSYILGMGLDANISNKTKTTYNAGMFAKKTF